MADIEATIEYLEDLELYDNVKPYWCSLPPRDGFDPDKERLDNLEFESRKIQIHDMRFLKDKPRIDVNGFQVFDHTTQISRFEAPEDVARYKSETEELHLKNLGAVYVKCYDMALRTNILFDRTEYDLNDPLHTEGPVRGAHNDISRNFGPQMINKHLPDREKELYMRPGYRFRIINTWRSLLPIVEDRPLALCDSRSVAAADLISCDRIVPEHIGEVYFLKHNSNHKWYWLSRQKDSEPFAFVMYDTKAGPHARFCPHVSFDNPQSSREAPPRESVETRSLVITRE
ncbi:uncharacterized protein LY89DRAFT_687163 [Mollisia scopiformis]|uniref:Methyltransferase n=1 Tax=Mollisia scopiformis TaxID=149040 RepID=A0A194X1U1_MOLSC|nr:uncharacterized protein LY89DRAFT_687163 [Mollisia scopiformis]KUJ13807.1 hypothetical protein LY89DRAFT_687163 [Mollisia scopiformis]